MHENDKNSKTVGKKNFLKENSSDILSGTG